MKKKTKKKKTFTVQMRIEGTLVFTGVEAKNAEEAMVKVDNEMMGDADLSKMDFSLIAPEWSQSEGKHPGKVVFWGPELAEKFYGKEA